MKRFLFSIMFVLTLAACVPTGPWIVDTRELAPTPTYTPWVLGPVNDTATPTDTVAMTATVAATETPVCDIKGTYASHLYHVKGQLTYRRTKVQEERGDKWFCSSAEAESAGFKKAKK